MNGPSWYDVLGVAPSATTAEIEAAWQAETAGRTPADRRFRLATQAAEVLLDAEARAAYDATLTPAEPAEPAEPAGPEASADVPLAAGPGPAADTASGDPAPTEAIRLEKPAPPTDEPAAEPTGDAAPAAPRRAVIAAAVAVVLLAFTVVAVVLRPDTAETDSTLPDAAEVTAARAAAEAAVVPVLSYDYRDLDASRAAAVSYLTPAYAEEYTRNFDAYITELAPQSKTIVTTRLVASSIVRTGPDRVDVLVFVNRPTQNSTRTVEYKDFVTLQMVRSGDRWLVGCLVTQDGGACTD